MISQCDYSAFRGKKKIRIPEFSDSDSDFENVAPTKRQCIDLTTPDDGNEMSGVMSRMEALEKTMKQSIGHLEEQERLKKTSSQLWRVTRQG